jgi:hypothetical protein
MLVAAIVIALLAGGVFAIEWERSNAIQNIGFALFAVAFAVFLIAAVHYKLLPSGV